MAYNTDDGKDSNPLIDESESDHAVKEPGSSNPLSQSCMYHIP